MGEDRGQSWAPLRWAEGTFLTAVNEADVTVRPLLERVELLCVLQTDGQFVTSCPCCPGQTSGLWLEKLQRSTVVTNPPTVRDYVLPLKPGTCILCASTYTWIERLETSACFCFTQNDVITWMLPTFTWSDTCSCKCPGLRETSLELFLFLVSEVAPRGAAVFRPGAPQDRRSCGPALTLIHVWI